MLHRCFVGKIGSIQCRKAGRFAGSHGELLALDAHEVRRTPLSQSHLRQQHVSQQPRRDGVALWKPQDHPREETYGHDWVRRLLVQPRVYSCPCQDRQPLFRGNEKSRRRRPVTPSDPTSHPTDQQSVQAVNASALECVQQAHGTPAYGNEGLGAAWHRPDELRNFDAAQPIRRGLDEKSFGPRFKLTVLTKHACARHYFPRLLLPFLLASAGLGGLFKRHFDVEKVS